MKKILEKAGLIGLTEDCAINEIAGGKMIVTNVDIFTPIHDDPIIQGEITACNVTNDVFAKNVIEIISYLSFLGVPPQQPDEITQGIIEGQRKFLKQFNSEINGGHTIVNPWPLTGGIALGICNKNDLIPKQIDKNASYGDLIITKPLGIQASMAAYRVMNEHPEFLEEFDTTLIKEIINVGVKIMRTSNYYVPKTIHENNIREYIVGMTDITGFGIKIHSEEMIEQRKIDIELDTFPIIINTDKLSNLFGYGLLEGISAETAGPMLIAIDTSKVDTQTIQDILKRNNIPSWKVGTFKKGTGNVRIMKDLNVIHVETYP